MNYTTTSEQVVFGGLQGVYQHQSDATGGTMEFSVFTPPAAKDGPVPVVWYLSGLTCTQENVTTKAGFQRVASELGLMIVCPDTSPRGEGVADDDAYDMGQGAGFYVNATNEPWATHFQMYSYVTQELPSLIAQAFPADVNRQGIMGHSMGGHGALTIGLKHPDRYRSLSAFAPIVAPTRVPWGQKALPLYLGSDESTWAAYDACLLMQAAGDRSTFPEILIDQGSDDPFLEEQLKPELFVDACEAAGQTLLLRRQLGYDHSYYLMATFMEDHLRHHAAILG